jgi:CheY-like chemotaxis protein
MTDNPTVLILDNTKSNQAIFKTYLEMQGFTVHFAENGNAALPTIRQIMPDIVLLNVAAPVRGDHTVLAAIKNDPDLRDIPTMVLMARQIAETDAKWLQAWSDDFLEKPFDVSDFLSKLQRLVRLAKDQNIVMLTPRKQKVRDKAFGVTFRIHTSPTADFPARNQS